MTWATRLALRRRGIAIATVTHAAGLGSTGDAALDLRLDATTPRPVVDGLVSGLRVPGESHFDLLRAFAPRARLDRGLALARDHGLSTHELGAACRILP